MTVSRNAGTTGTERAGTMPEFLNVDGVGEILAVSPRHVRRMADEGKMPAPVRLGACVRWPRRTIEKWITDGCPSCRRTKGGAR